MPQKGLHHNRRTPMQQRMGIMVAKGGSSLSLRPLDYFPRQQDRSWITRSHFAPNLDAGPP